MSEAGGALAGGRSQLVPEHDGASLSRPARVLASLIRGYQALRSGRPSPCRFTPSCSAYALQAVASHGARRGGWLSARRLARCHPWGGRGWDPVPQGAGTPHPAPDRTVA